MSYGEMAAAVDMLDVGASLAEVKELVGEKMSDDDVSDGEFNHLLCLLEDKCGYSYTQMLEDYQEAS